MPARRGAASRSLRRCVAGLLCAGLLLADAAAQAPGTQPGQVQRQFQPPPQPRASVGAFEIPPPAPGLPAGAAGIRFRLHGLSVDGATVYPPDAWTRDFAALIGREVTLAEVYGLAASLSARYRNDGYILSQVLVPAQVVDDGVLRLQAVEGHVAALRYSGAAAPALVQALAAPIVADRPLRAATLERALLLINDLPGVSARAVLMPSPSQGGASDVVIQLSQQAWGAGLSVDNRGGRALGPWRATVDGEQRGLLGAGSRSVLRAVQAQHDRMRLASLAHEQAAGSAGARIGLALSTVRSTPDTGASFIPLNLETSSDAGALSVSYPLLRSRERNLAWRAALTAHDGSTELFGVRDTQDRIRALRMGATADLADAAGGVSLVDVELARGLSAAGASRAGDALLSRAGGQPDFTKLTLYAARLQTLGRGWSLLLALSAQRAFDDLLSPELFSYGGEQFGRGHDPSELVGDHGAAAKLELRYTPGGDRGRGLAGTVYAFYDAGQVRQRTALGAAARTSASSAGVGLRWEWAGGLSGYVEAAQPLTHPVAAQGNRHARGYAGLAMRH